MSYSGSNLRFDSQYWIIHDAKHTLIQIKLNNLSNKKKDDTDQYFDDSDIKFDSILMSTISPTTIRNII